MEYEIRPVTPEELPAFRRADLAGFGERPREQPNDQWSGAELDRARAAVDGDRIVGTGRNYSLELTLPGGSAVGAGGVSWISVLPTHRRRGILTAMMDALLDDSRARGESVSILTASEGGIYERFGFGITAWAAGIEIDRREVAFRGELPEGRVRLVDVEESGKVLPPVFERARRVQPGAVSRPDVWWTDEYAGPDDAGSRFDAVFENTDATVDGYVTYHVARHWREGVADGRIDIRDLVGVTPDAYAALWRYVCGIDLVRTIRAWHLPIDAPLPWLLASARAVRTTSVRDGLWLRPLDTAALLAARRYAERGRVVLEVAATFSPEGTAGRFALEGGPDGAVCGPSASPPDLALGAADLGAAFLGGVSFATLAETGRVEERASGALARADAMFRTERAPFGMTWF